MGAFWTLPGTRNFTFDSLDGAKARRLNWRNRIAECYQKKIISESDIRKKVLDAVNNNLNSPEAFAMIDGSVLSLSDWEFVDELFGLALIKDCPRIGDEVLSLIHERQIVREQKDFALSDKIRDKLLAQGITVKDTPDGPVLQYA